MTRGLNFSESFWDSDITGTLGWDRLVKRMKDGKNVCTSVQQYMKERAKAETDYCKALSNIAKKVDGKEETGDLGMSWRELKGQTERIASYHDEAAKHFNALADELTKFIEEQKPIKSQTEDGIKKQIQAKRTEYQKTMTAKKNYESKCSEKDTADINLHSVKQSVTVKKNEYEKAERNREKANENMKNADSTYKSAVQSLESVRQKWEEQTIQACNVFQDLEMKRIELLRDLLWRCTNIDSMTCVGHDDCCERVRSTLETCDVEKDVQEFIDNNKTGSAKPVPVDYESYYKTTDHTSVSKPNFRPPMIPPGRPPQLPPPSTRPHPNTIDEGTYASISMPGSSCKVLLQVIRDHDPVNPSELRVNIGDVLEMVKPKNRHNMITVKYPDQNRIFVIPEACVTNIAYV